MAHLSPFMKRYFSGMGLISPFLQITNYKE
nr:MAG TPA: hypothetical protein [Bacteriophage sp.]